MVRRYTLVEPDRTIFFNSHMTEWLTEWVSYCLLVVLLSPIRPFHTSLLVLPAPGTVRCFLNTLLLFQDSSVCDFRRTFRFLPSWKYFYLHCMPPPSPITGLQNFFLCVFAVHSRCSVRRLQKKKENSHTPENGRWPASNCTKMLMRRNQRKKNLPQQATLVRDDWPTVQQYHYYGLREPGSRPGGRKETEVEEVEKKITK